MLEQISFSEMQSSFWKVSTGGLFERDGGGGAKIQSLAGFTNSWVKSCVTPYQPPSVDL